MVDASIGGKTGVDVPAGKNLVGAFHPARAVLADPTVLATLPMPERRAGFAEMLKHGAIADAAHFEQLAADATRLLAPDAPPDPLVEAIATSVRLKASVVANDPTEVGQRAILNAGHTIAHAIEHLTGYAVRHGEAVAMGLVLEAAAGEALGVTAAGTSGAMRRACEAAGLPVALPPGLSADAMLQAMRLDKKARAGAVRCALPAAIGRMARDGEAWTIPVPDDVWRAVLRS
jgi:3-dehydroquinate synthase